MEHLAGKSREMLLTQGLTRAVTELEKRLGPDTAKWQWGKLHQIRFPHALASKKLLDGIFSQGPFPVGGDSDTINQVAIAPGGDYRENSVSPAYRQVVNLADLDDSKAMFVPGQSGHLGSNHYGDLIQPWLSGAYFSMANNGIDEDHAACRAMKLIPDTESA